MPDLQGGDGWIGAGVPTAPTDPMQDLEPPVAALDEEPTRTDAVDPDVLAALSSDADEPAPQEVQPPAEVSEPLRETQPEPLFSDLQVESTAIVDPSTMQRPAQVLTLDLESGQVSSEAVALDESDWQPGKRRSTGLIVGGVLVALVVVLGGVAAAVMLGGDEEPSAPVATLPGGAGDGAEAETAEAETAETQSAETQTAETQSAETQTPEAEATDPEDPEAAASDSPLDAADPGADDPEGADGESADAEPLGEDDPGETPDAPAAAPAGGTTVAEIEAFELVRPETSARARRMSDADRRRQAGRFRARGLRAYRAEHWSDAARLFRQALSYNDWDIASVEGLARTHAQQNNFPEAVAWAELAVQRNPRSPATFRVLGDVWRQAGHPDRARQVWQRGLRRHPRDRWLRRRLRELE